MAEVEKSVIYEVMYQSTEPSSGKVRCFGSYRDKAVADGKAAKMTERRAGETSYWVVEKDVTGAFTPPSPRLPRERFTQDWTEKPSKPGCWRVTDVLVTDQDSVLDGVPAVAAAYHRNYPGQPPFEPFRQRDAHGTERHYALISESYQRTSVIDLQTGQVCATEKRDGAGYGFCPVGFYVPDWHDVHDDSVTPGSYYWDEHDELPDGKLGFVWGCYWGDDNGWKVQALDLSRVCEGALERDDRFGYRYLDTAVGDPRKFIRYEPGEGDRGPRVTFSSPVTYDTGGKLLYNGDGGG
jgi:hypothetical protein